MINNSQPPGVTYVRSDHLVVVIYDGKWHFCQGQIARLRRWDSANRLTFLSLHDPVVAERYPDLSHDQLMDQMYLIDAKGIRYGGAAAFRVISRMLPRLWLVMPLLHIPLTLPFWQWAYRRFAAQRYRWNRDANSDACENGTCDIHFGKSPKSK